MKYTFYIFMFLFSCAVFSQNSWNIKAGLNFSSSRNNDTEFITNYSLGISKRINIHSDYFISPEFLITQQGTLIKNTPVWTDGFDEFLDSYNIKAVHTYIELPILISYRYKIKNNNLFLFMGPSYRFAFFDFTNLYNRKNIFDENHPERKNEFKEYIFEFKKGDYEGFLFKSPAWSYIIGVSADLNVFNIEVRYTYTFNKMGQIGQLHPINRNLHSLHFLLGLNL